MAILIALTGGHIIKFNFELHELIMNRINTLYRIRKHKSVRLNLTVKNFYPIISPGSRDITEAAIAFGINFKPLT